MLGACVSRLQHAVGHGGFHTGHIQNFEPLRTGAEAAGETEIESFRYVYDCGSEQSGAFKSELNAHRLSSNGRTDILFVSHLHSDHINGIEHLQATAPAETVVVPYLDVIERLIFVLADTESGAISTSAREYFGNPASWWLGRGARYVIFLEADDGDAPQPDGPVEPDGPVDGDDGGFDRRPDAAAWPKDKRPAARLAHYLRKPRGTVPNDLTAADETAKDLADGAVLAGAGSLFRLEWRRHEHAGWQVGDWILLPYVHPVDRAVRSRFQRAITKALKIKGGNEEKLAAKLIEYLVSYEKTKVLIDIYGEHFGHGQNALSMSLYSGPYCRSEGPVDGAHRWQRYRSGWSYAHYSSFVEPVGWLGTGDSALKQKPRRDPWLAFYRPYQSDVAVMTLPHHGSAHNFHDEILAFDNLKMALATTVERRERVAGMRDTLAAVEARGIRGHVVDDQRTNTYRFWCGRIMGR
ncbi:MBL fold metallo-hydrolase [Mesorhizobium sp. M0924]|uniref:MBL fold metallo-hydrolase n=1 Tax=unclassified Mesorhizobium TaxID=325217 RepID=UPI00333B8DCF